MFGALFVAVVVLLLFGITVWAGVDAAFFPDRVWESARISRGGTMTLIFFGCVLGAAYYFGFVRPRLLRAQAL